MMVQRLILLLMMIINDEQALRLPSIKEIGNEFVVG
jgi:hypothetical protein